VAFAPELRTILLCAVALVAADSSIVVLAIPELLTRFGSSISDTAWTITGFNAAAAIGALIVYFLRSRSRARSLLVGGLMLFAAATVGCAAATSLTFLIEFRAIQGVGASLVLAGAVIELGSTRAAAATTVGLALGPALGGALTQAFSWRAIFVAQLPVAGAAVLPAARATRRARRAGTDRLHGRDALALVFSSAALVGALFLAVMLIVEGHGLSPISAAAVVSLLPAAGLRAPRLFQASPAFGLGALAGGLALLMLSTSSLPLVAVALLGCGLGLGLSMPFLSERVALLGVAARHAGVVLGLALIAPLVAHDVSANAHRAELEGAALVVRAPIPLLTKTVLGVRLYQQTRHTRNGRLPDFRATFRTARRLSPGAAPELTQLEHRLTRTERDAVASSFARSFGVSSLLAVLALLTLLSLRLAGPVPLTPRSRRRSAADAVERNTTDRPHAA